MIDRYVEFVGQHEIDAIYSLAERLRDFSILHINSTAAGGGVAEILSRMVPLMRSLGLRVDWKVIRGDEEFFRVIKHIHNSLQGGRGELTKEQIETYRKWQEANANELDLDYDVVFVHDPQPAGLIEHKRRGLWIWRCHIDLSTPSPQVWGFLRRYVERYDGAIFHIPEFARGDLKIPQMIIPPSIDPLSPKNKPLHEATVRRILRKFGVDDERPVLTQISRYDRAKDPVGVIRAFKVIKSVLDAQLVYLGSPAADDPEGEEVYREAVKAAEGVKDVHLLMLPPDSHVEVNAFQRASAVVFQKSIREGFGLTVSEALWKERPVLGGNAGGIRVQIIHGVNGFLVETPEEAAYYALYLLKNEDTRMKMGVEGKEHVRRNFLITHHIRRYLMAVLYLAKRARPTS